jgi:hypothetical protein
MGRLKKFQSECTLTSVRPEIVDFGPEQGLSDFETAGIARYFEDFKRAKTQLGAKRWFLWLGNKYEVLPSTSFNLTYKAPKAYGF